jgi:hypothetical protein
MYSTTYKVLLRFGIVHSTYPRSDALDEAGRLYVGRLVCVCARDGDCSAPRPEPIIINVLRSIDPAYSTG